MERVGKVWSNLKRGCQSLLHPDGDARDHQATTTQEEASPPRPPSRSSTTPTVVSGRSNHAATTTTRSISGDLSAFSSIRRHPGQNCAVVDMAQVLEITLEQEVDGRLGQLGTGRRDSYSRHAPWSGKKRHSCSTRNAQGSLEGRGSGRGGGGRCRHRGDELDADGGTTGSAVRTLRQQLQDTVGLCLPLRCSTSRTPPKRKIHLTELMMETCPFPPNSDLARKWHLIKQHTTPVANAADSSSSSSSPNTSSSSTQPPLPPSASTLSSSSSSATSGQQDWPRGGGGGGGAGAALSAEDEEERLRERRRLSIEEGVDPPPNAQIHTLEAAAPLAALHKLGPKLAPGLGEGLGEAGGGAGARGGGGGGGGGGTGAAGPPDCDSEEEDGTTLCLQTRRSRHRHAHHHPPPSSSSSAAAASSGGEAAGPWRVHTQIDYIHCLVPDLQRIAALPCYWGVMDRYQAEALLDGRPEGSFLLRDSAQEDYLFSVSFRRYGRSLHARIEQWNHNFSFDAHDPCVFHAATVTALLEHYKDPSACMFFEPLLTLPLARAFPFGLQTLARAAICGRVSYDSIGTLPLPPPLQDYLREYHYKQRVRVRWLERELKVK